jgi:hypothetical protein
MCHRLCWSIPAILFPLTVFHTPAAQPLQYRPDPST